MEDNPYFKLAQMVLRGNSETSGLCLATVTSWPTQQNPARPHKVIAGGTTQEREDLMKSSTIGTYDLLDGDKVLALSIEDAQRYVLICKVVDV